MAILVKLMHFVFFGIYLIVAISYIRKAQQNAKSSDPNVKFLGEVTFRYLTIWTYGMQLLYYACMVIAHSLSVAPVLNKASNKVRSLADSLFTTIVLPVGLMVTLSFWALYNIDRELVFPNWIDKVIPLWMNHFIHTFNSILPLIDMVVCYHKFSSWSFSTICILLYSGAYTICFFGTYYTYGRWLYPMFDKFTYPEIGYFILGNLCFTMLMHAITRLTNNLIWGSSIEKPKLKKSKHKTKKVA